MPTLADVIAKINNDIIPNGNEEITGIILNSVLLDMVAQINDLVGELNDLHTDDATSIVNAINSLKQELDDYINSQMGVLGGLSDPNEETPIGFDGRIGSIYIQNGIFGFNIMPLSYWIYTGIDSIGWLNLTADDVFKMIVVDHYTDLPAQGQTNRIYFVQDENNTYIWNVNIFPNDYVLVGGVIEGEFIDDTTFNDEFGNPVVPNTGNLYLDTVTGKYYRWDGTYFLPIDQDTGGGGSNLTLEQARQNGNVLEGDVIIYQEDFEDSPKFKYSTIVSDVDVYVNDEGLYRIDSLSKINENYSVLEISQDSLTVSCSYESKNFSITFDGENFLRGNEEFDKQGDRKAFAQIADVEDAIANIPSGDFSDLTNNVIPKKSSSGNELEDSNIQDTATGVSVDGRTDTDLVIEKAVNASASSSFTIDLNNPSGHYDLTLTDNTSISFSNMIGTNQSTVITLVVGGNYSLLFPSWLKPTPNNDSYYSNSASDVNLITILIRNGGGSPQGIYSLTNVDLS